jgi:hypothetical protein
MLSILHPDPPLPPHVERKMRDVQIFGSGTVAILWVVSMVALMGYLPNRIFWLASTAESFFSLYIIRKSQSLRKQAGL